MYSTVHNAAGMCAHTNNVILSYLFLYFSRHLIFAKSLRRFAVQPADDDGDATRNCKQCPPTPTADHRERLENLFVCAELGMHIIFRVLRLHR